MLVLAQAERMMGICGRLAACIADPRDHARVVNQLEDIFLARVLAIACGYEDADDLDALRDDPGFRLTLGKPPGAGAGLASQPTISRWENAPTTRELAKMLATMIDVYCVSYPTAPADRLFSRLSPQTKNRTAVRLTIMWGRMWGELFAEPKNKNNIRVLF